MTNTQPTELRQAGFVWAAAAIGAGCAAVTVYWCAAMPVMSSMSVKSPMWPMAPVGGGLFAFLSTWTVMMVAMMMPVLVPMLRRYRLAMAQVRPEGIGRRTAVVGLAYFAVWTAAGVVAFAIGTGVDLAQHHAPAIADHSQTIGGIVVVAAGALQFSRWKAHHLACCRSNPTGSSAVWHGVRIGLHCCAASVGLMAILLVLGVMNLAVMALVTAATAIERLAPVGRRVAYGIGVIALAAGTGLIVAGVMAG
jgi:predicted metal-binding membrane protein